ncbi:MAG: flagellar export protein FliJ [Desulfobulbaceae bacterium]|nr:flagellar export protein FliJ [Desulfobulbaceae bacterium]
MKPFQLTAVLDHRKRLEDIAHNRFFEANKIHKLISKKLTFEKELLTTTIKQTEARKRQGIEIVSLIRFEEKIQSIQFNVKAIEKTLAEKKNIVEMEKANLLQCSKERQIMERLRDKQNRNWKNYLNKKEAAMLDEIAIMRHGPESNY